MLEKMQQQYSRIVLQSWLSPDWSLSFPQDVEDESRLKTPKKWNRLMESWLSKSMILGEGRQRDGVKVAIRMRLHDIWTDFGKHREANVG